MLELILSLIFGIAVGFLVLRDLVIQHKVSTVLFRFFLYIAVSTSVICVTSYFVNNVF